MLQNLIRLQFLHMTSSVFLCVISGLWLHSYKMERLLIFYRFVLTVIGTCAAHQSLSLSLSLSLSPVPHPTFCQNSYPLSLSLSPRRALTREGNFAGSASSIQGVCGSSNIIMLQHLPYSFDRSIRSALAIANAIAQIEESKQWYSGTHPFSVFYPGHQFQLSREKPLESAHSKLRQSQISSFFRPLDLRRTKSC